MSIPLARLASLDLIRGFVAVGRRMSITLAAQDLHLTQSAVSRQIQALEEALGIKLFNRGHRAVSFTPEGERLFHIADEAMQQLQNAFGAARPTSERLPVTVTSSIGFSSLWLLPRLGRFQQRHPDIDVRVAADNKVLDLRAEGIDLAVRYCAEAKAPPGSERLFDEFIVPVAHPSLGLRQLDSPDAVARNVLLEYDDPRRPWLGWADRLNAMGFGAVKPKGMLRFNQYDQAVQAALAGQGIALGRLALVQPLLADKRLVALGSIEPDVSGGYSYWLVQADNEPRREVADVVTWIRTEAKSAESLQEPNAA
jgi:LysR family transcriptional regulator, glycine cleavage system transcriptional activator